MGRKTETKHSIGKDNNKHTGCGNSSARGSAKLLFGFRLLFECDWIVQSRRGRVNHKEKCLVANTQEFEYGRRLEETAQNRIPGRGDLQQRRSKSEENHQRCLREIQMLGTKKRKRIAHQENPHTLNTQTNREHKGKINRTRPPSTANSSFAALSTMR